MKNSTLFIVFLLSVGSYAQNIELELFASGVPNPVNIKHAGDSRLFVVDRDGLIYIINEEGVRNEEPFLDIRPKVSNGGDERGLLGLAFHPNYSENGYFYVNYVNNRSQTIISRFSTSSNNDLADPKSEFDLLTIPQPDTNHNGGELIFDKDGFLLIALGDGGGQGDPDNNSQSLKSLLGKILRIDVDRTQNGQNYAIPSDNPFVNDSNIRHEIWAYGLRNPWKVSLDRTTNDLWIADVGQDNFEEINKVSATQGGLNFGWRCYEGTAGFNLDDCPDKNTITFPTSIYSHANSGNFKCSITGGYRYRGTAQPTLSGIYFFADFCSTEIGLLKESNGDWDMTFTETFDGNSWTTFGEDVNGELYIAAISSGSIYRIKDANLGLEDQNFSQIKIYPNPVNEQLNVAFGTTNNQITDIQVYNIQGQQIKTAISFDAHVSKISTKNMAKGLYIMEVHDQQGQKTTHKFVKN